jgi:hypothetical protein
MEEGFGVKYPELRHAIRGGVARLLLSPRRHSV